MCGWKSSIHSPSLARATWPGSPPSPQKMSRSLVRLKWMRPLVALHVIGGALAGLEVVAGEIRSPRPWDIASRTRWFRRRGPRIRGPRSRSAMVRLWMSVLCVPSVWIIQMRSTFCHGPSWQYISSSGSVGEKSRWLIQSVECSRTLMSPGFSPLGPGSRRMVKS